MNWYGDQYPASEPLDTDDGISAGAGLRNWWSIRWLALLNELVTPGRLKRGRSYAQVGQLLSLEHTSTGVRAEVLGTRQPPYSVSIRTRPLTQAQWDDVFDALEGQAIYSAQLLTGELPPDVEDVFQSVGVSLFPSEKEFTAECTCPDWARPCKHAVAVCHIVAEQIDADPFLLFRWRGRSREEVLAELGVQSDASPTAELRTVADVEPAPPLDESLDNFWEMGASLDTFRVTMAPPQTDVPVLKRLGQPDFLKQDIIKLLRPAYRAVSEAALDKAFSDDDDDDKSETD